jgi:Tfp pilus assembly protein PilZ
MAVTTILLICREGQSRQLYQAELNSAGVLLVAVQMLTQFFRRELFRPISGILVDMPTYMRSTEEEKRLLMELVGLFPALRIKCNESSGEIRTLPFGTAYPGNLAPVAFVQTYCTPFLQRKIRSSERSLQHLSALLSRSLVMDAVSGTRSVTANVCSGGCFLISFEPWSVGDRGWLTLPELHDSEPISVEVCWIRPWGEQRALPGMGIRFIDPSAVQKVELSRLGGRSFMLEDQEITGAETGASAEHTEVQ